MQKDHVFMRTWPWLSKIARVRRSATAPACAFVASDLSLAEELGIGGNFPLGVVRAQVGDVDVIVRHAAT
jgi:hypothetical protein